MNYLQPFIPGLSTITTFLCEQLAKWDWYPLTDAAFWCLKVWICQILLNTTPMCYNRSKPVIVQTDASEYGLGTALIQSRCPITFASKTFTDVPLMVVVDKGARVTGLVVLIKHFSICCSCTTHLDWVPIATDTLF